MYAVGHKRVISIGGPCLAPEVAQGLPCAVVFASADQQSAEVAAAAFRTSTYHVTISDDLPGVEYSMVAKNVAAIGLGVLDGLGKGVGFEYRNAKSALFTSKPARSSSSSWWRWGKETATGLAGMGDVLVTMLGGRNRLFGELLGEGIRPDDALADLTAKGMTVEEWRPRASSQARRGQGTGPAVPGAGP